ncbi:PDDEXK nuclease domain-containing protein [Glaciimonas sp. CA11.2]|uniref:PDDEXK nuclease domain-containing protein n=1 Tax=Glaciimonas sp. CA11.2 TaxID=3048601 RepID=UPI002AB4CD7A|nr:PDDEXK nuclease domain-containing protein [Glaciimonas sp. CA11.2]MDY7545496.1 PDDEXK nuclease domain-containing protein [Glaciimonas sp. CA11.2]MEB0163001.1 PDDEXK nuclease domain-containing protein [Glaciimonas sp. CA11.2]
MTKLLAEADLPADYAHWLSSLKQRIQSAQQRAVLAVNHELVLLYWQIGRDILERQQAQGWGAKVIDRLAKDLSAAFPEMKGFAPRSLKYMRAFAQAWPEPEFVQEVLAQLPWYHQLTLLDKLKSRKEREWYVVRAIEHGWSRNILVMQIETKLHQRQGAAQTNFANRLPAVQSDLARNTLKDPYIFDFLGLGEEAQERDIELALVQHVTKFLLELGAGFAFVGRQYRLTVGDEEFYIDLLFYHLKLRCYVVVELKATPFKPEYAGQLNFYLSAIDADVKAKDDNPTIGLLLCKDHNRTVAEYALRGMDKPMGIANYQLVRAIPENLATNLPTIEQIEMELQWSGDDDNSVPQDADGASDDVDKTDHPGDAT